MTRPHKIVARVESVRRIMESPPEPSSSRWGKWMAYAPLPAFLRGDGGDATPPSALGGRARWLSTGTSVALPLRARARKFVTLEIDDSLA
jgi:hypothetical protein